MANRIGIAGHPGHDISYSGMVEEIKVQFLQFLIHIFSEIVQRILTHAFKQQLIQVPNDCPYHGRSYHDQ